MTRKDFELIAGVLAEASTEANLAGDKPKQTAISEIAADFAVRLKGTNPRFDTVRFLKAALNEGLLK